MNKIISLIFTACFAVLSTFGQSIAPNPTTEQCPNTNITFTVTLPLITANSTPLISAWTGNPTIVGSISNLTSSGTQTTFTFVGKFRDDNISQTFRVNYATTLNPSAIADFPFKRIKSLLTANSYSQINPTPLSITAQRC